MDNRYAITTPWQRIALERLLEKRKDLTLGTAKDLFEGTMSGDEVLLVDAEALEFGMWPFREVHDHSVVHDNGMVPVYFGRGMAFLDTDAPVLFLHAWNDEPRTRLDDPIAPPRTIDLGDYAEVVDRPEPHHAGGQLVIVERMGEEPEYLVCWRRDGRMRKDLVVLSGHYNEEFARTRIHQVAEDFDPGQRMRRGMPRGLRDYQRDKLYQLEGLVGVAGNYQRQGFETIEGCRQFLREVYEDLDLGMPPPVQLGPRNTTTSFYRMRDGITLAGWGMERWTLLHEAAHHLARKTVRDEPGHGPTFVGILAGLLQSHAGIDAGIFERLAKEHGVDLSVDAMKTIIDRSAIPAPTP